MTKTPPTNKELHSIIFRHLFRQNRRIAMLAERHGEDKFLEETRKDTSEVIEALATLVKNANEAQGIFNGGVTPKEAKDNRHNGRQTEKQEQLQLA